MSLVYRYMEDVDEFLLWLSAQSPEGRKAIGFVDYYLDLYPVPRMSQDEHYMSGWDEAVKMGGKAKNKTPPSSNLP